MHLDRLPADEARGVAGVGLGGGARERRAGIPRVERPRRAIDGRARGLRAEQHLRHAMLERLEGADRPPEGLALAGVAHGGLVDRGDLAVGQVRRPGPLRARRQLVAQADVREGPAHHHLVVPAA